MATANDLLPILAWHNHESPRPCPRGIPLAVIFAELLTRDHVERVDVTRAVGLLRTRGLVEIAEGESGSRWTTRDGRELTAANRYVGRENRDARGRWSIIDAASLEAWGAWEPVDELLALTPAGLAEIDRPDTPPEAAPPEADDAPAMTASARRVARSLHAAGPAVLLTAENLADEAELSRATVLKVVRALIVQGLVERPEGPRGGARLTNAGRRLASTLGPED